MIAAMNASVLHLLRVGRIVLRRFVVEGFDQLSASLAYLTLLSLVPCVAVFLGVLSVFPGLETHVAEIDRFVAGSLLPEHSGAQIVEYVLSFSRNAAEMTRLGAAGVVVSVFFLILSAERALNGVWQVAAPAGWWRRVGLCLAILCVWPLLLLAVVSLAYEAVSLSLEFVPIGDVLRSGLLRLGGLLIAALCFAAVYGLVPNVRVRARHALAGGACAALGFLFLQKGFAFYVGHVPTFSVLYGAFAVVPIFLLWLYLSWAVILLGALVAASLAQVR